MISDQVRMLKSSIQVKSEDWYRVLKLSQKINIKTQFNNQSNIFYDSCFSYQSHEMIELVSLEVHW